MKQYWFLSGALTLIPVVGCFSAAPTQIETLCVSQSPADWCSYFGNNRQYLCPASVADPSNSCLQLANVQPDSQGNLVWCCDLRPMCRYTGYSPPCAMPNAQFPQVGYDCIFGSMPAASHCSIVQQVSNNENVVCCDKGSP